jgi:Phage integrase family
VQRILTEGKKRRNSARWAVALALGLRQGETLGLMWTDVDLDRGVLRVRRGRLRPKYEHGCGGACQRKHAGYCPERRQVRPTVANTKSKAGRRSIGLPDQLVELLREHKRQQDAERSKARQLWDDGGWVFASETGRPLNPNPDYHRWKALLAAAGVREGRLHDARHTATTVLLLLGVPERAAMGVMGWSSTAMAARYQHMTDPIRQDIARRVGGMLWAVPDAESGQAESDRDPAAASDDAGDGPAGTLMPARFLLSSAPRRACLRSLARRARSPVASCHWTDQVGGELVEDVELQPAVVTTSLCPAIERRSRPTASWRFHWIRLAFLQVGRVARSCRRRCTTARQRLGTGRGQLVGR